jgi:hypothetical protein
MPFHWNRPYQESLLERYPAGTIGLDAWGVLVGELASLDPTAMRADTSFDWLNLIDQFIGNATLDAEQKGRPSCCVFVSHKQQDVAYAERIAYQATQNGLDYWLDVHDPNLVLVQQTLQPTDPRLPILIAAIIEIGLLNSSHVAAVHTSNSSTSKWIPYEFGRAKSRQVHSTQAAGWLEPSLQLSACGEYVQLAVVAHGGERGLIAWLKNQNCRNRKLPWPYPIPAALP